jgi:EAL domain-containing protein (putative c-di-GMP-specific phosphodiesterase class I)
MADQNARLLVFLKKLEDASAGFLAAHIHVSQIQTAKKTRENLSRAIKILSELKTRYKTSEIFLMKNVDIVFISKDISEAVLCAACGAIQQVFLGSVGVEFTNVHGDDGEFFTLFDLSYKLSEFVAWAESVAGVAAVQPGNGQLVPKEAIDLAMLSRIREEIQKIDISPMLFNQPVYAIGDEKKPSIVFHETYISVQVLEETLCPGLSLTARRWLFTDLTEELDTVVLRTLSTNEERTARRRISINVNLSSLASAKFVRFDSELPVDARHNIILEINKTDVFENMRLYREIVPFLRDRGFRILLDGLSFLNVAAIDFDGIECDFAKVFWSTELSSLHQEVCARLVAKMSNRDKPRFLLARCDSANSLRFARSAGIRLVQGRLADHMVKRGIPF